MAAQLTLAAIAVAGGLAMAAIGWGRAIAAGRPAGGLLQNMLDDQIVLRQDTDRPLSERLIRPAGKGLQRFARKVTPDFWLARIRRNVTLAGLGGKGVEKMMAAKAVSMLVGTIFAPLMLKALGARFGAALVWAVLGGIFGFLLPDLWIGRRANARQADIRSKLPETLDLLAIAVRAGLGLEAAIQLVSRKLPGALGEEFQRLLQEIQLGSSRRQALQHLRERTEVSELSTFALALVQADAMGSPIADVLQSHAAEIRMLRRLRARETAAKLPVKLLFPLLLTIFPAMGVVVVGPAIVRIVEALF